MGRVKTHDIKKISIELVRRHSDKFNTDFTNNKKALDEFKVADSKRTRNKIAGYITRTVKKNLKS